MSPLIPFKYVNDKEIIIHQKYHDNIYLLTKVSTKRTYPCEANNANFNSIYDHVSCTPSQLLECVNLIEFNPIQLTQYAKYSNNS